MLTLATGAFFFFYIISLVDTAWQSIHHHLVLGQNWKALRCSPNLSVEVVPFAAEPPVNHKEALEWLQMHFEFCQQIWKTYIHTCFFFFETHHSLWIACWSVAFCYRPSQLSTMESVSFHLQSTIKRTFTIFPLNYLRNYSIYAPSVGRLSKHYQHVLLLDFSTIEMMCHPLMTLV